MEVELVVANVGTACCVVVIDCDRLVVEGPLLVGDGRTRMIQNKSLDLGFVCLYTTSTSQQ